MEEEQAIKIARAVQAPAQTHSHKLNLELIKAAVMERLRQVQALKSRAVGAVAYSRRDMLYVFTACQFCCNYV